MNTITAYPGTTLGVCFLLCLPLLLPAQDVPGRKQLEAYQLAPGEELLFDGKVDEHFWDNVKPAAGFRQQEPNEGAAASERTEVRIAYDENYLYLGVMLYDRDPSGIKANQKRRDVRIVADERFTWIFDTYNDQRSAYFMEINPNGLRTDGLISTGQGISINLNWDGIWDARTVIGDFGWSAEIKIPFRTLNFDMESDRWGTNFMRVIRRKSETVLWSGYRRNQGIERPQDAGLLTGLTGMSQGLGLEVVPFGVLNGSEQRREAGDDTKADMDGGLDVNYSITPSLKASLTFNTDFAEAEVDQRQVNLTRFPLQFPEQRDFFLEGANIYEFAPASGVNPYFSRRIGLRDGAPVTITYGARLLGNAGGYNLALLHVRTGEKDEVQPEHFSVARVKRNIGSESTAGLIYTRRSARDAIDDRPALQEQYTLGGDLELGTSRFMGSDNLQFQAFFVFHNSPFVSDDTTGVWDRSSRGFRLNFPNQPWSAHVSYREFGDAFDPAVGFTPRNAFRRLQPTIEYTPQFSGSDIIRQVGWGIRFEHLTDLDFDLLTQYLTFTLFDIALVSDDQISLSITRNYERLEQPFDIKRDGSVIVPVDEYVNWLASVEMETASYRKISVDARFEGGGFWSGSQIEYGMGITLRPLPGIELSPEYIRTDVNVEEKFSTDLVRFEANLDFTTSLFLTTNIQFDNLSDLLAVNNRLRWIITPGSDLYLVYKHNWRDGRAGFRTTQRSGALKVSYTHRF
ncbi:hypothetical protein SAMN05443144_10312 [Fodinibius roseus]|uniref:DUF5916 domain-containing protein n=1 Tax=Fodinibius roseus TaxID=1194090 RepID=A0A1M4VR75_9BACT|nr:carbohydrate binding family 9 domain-containing protein [Fodinibius roseus]SHE71375.1 hypothetical protein SAMN05443144_10312 [Fodinibius roseus]